MGGGASNDNRARLSDESDDSISGTAREDDWPEDLDCTMFFYFYFLNRLGWEWPEPKDERRSTSAQSPNYIVLYNFYYLITPFTSSGSSNVRRASNVCTPLLASRRC